MKKENNHLQALIKINEQHAIFSGHFPNQPIVPGVCMLQITKEVLENVLGHKMQLRTADFLKFLAFIRPQENTFIHLDIQYTCTDNDAVKLSSSLFNEGTVFFKFKGEFSKKNIRNNHESSC
jgi:3-hydroxyacyl-[acyl-carrier-protein] dehydratase